MKEYGGDDMGVYDMESKETSQIYQGDDAHARVFALLYSMCLSTKWGRLVIRVLEQKERFGPLLEF